MSKRPTIPFLISHMDSLGQGVSKSGDKVTFIPKTLPGDAGEAFVTASKKGVVFARVQNLSQKSSDRIEPECPHFNECPSCHYLHTDYLKELEFKRLNLERMFQRISHPPVEVIPAVRRFAYRNRVQLHYDVKTKLLGMQDVGANRITPIPHCLIALPEIKKEIENLYDQQNWLREAAVYKPQGHVEIYLLNGKIHKSWNQPYAQGGFTQVFEEMNQVLRDRLKSWWGTDQKDLLDLFGGNGNLSKDLSYSRRLCVDIYSQAVDENFYSQHLYADDALKNVWRISQERGLQSPNILLDPPRSGIKNLQDWLNKFRPEKVAYVSCDPHTLQRDVSQLEGYEIKEFLLLDFFPSTFHFETVIFLTRK